MENKVHITRARHAWVEESGFVVNRPRGIREYTFLHFHCSVELLVGGEKIVALPGTCMF